jgi:hypothetical protein
MNDDILQFRRSRIALDFLDYSEQTRPEETASAIRRFRPLSLVRK